MIEAIMRIVIIAIIIILALIAIKKEEENRKRNKRQKENKISQYEENESYTDDEYYSDDKYYPYHKKYLITKNEYYFYKKLKEVAERNNLQILAKIRLADLIEVNKGLTASEWSRYFSKIKSKHIDFALADNMKIILIIELDDNSHNQEKRQERDTFVDGVLMQCRYNIVHTFGNIEQVEAALQEIRKTDTTDF